MLKRLAVIASFFLTLPFPLPAVEPQEQAGVSIVEVPVFVRDKAGKPVIDIRQDEVRVFEDGKEQKVEMFLPIDLRKREDIRLPTEVTRRNFILFFDVTFNSLGPLVQARNAAARFVDTGMPDGDEASVYAFSSLKGVFMVSNFTSDRRLLHAAIDSLSMDRRFESVADSAGFFNSVMLAEQMTLSGLKVEKPILNGKTTPGGRVVSDIAVKEAIRDLNAGFKRNDEDFYVNTVAGYVSNIRDFARSMQYFPGRKFLLFFSSGFDTKVLGDRDPNLAAEDAETLMRGEFEKWGASESARGRNTGLDLASVLAQAMRFFSSADCRVYPVDIGGMANDANISSVTDTTIDQQSIGRRQASLFSFADETGGTFYKNAIEPDKAIDDIVRSTEYYYMLAYTPPSHTSKKPGEYHEIKVQMTRPGIDFTFRKGYNEPLPFKLLTAEDRQLQVAEIINNNLAPEGLRFQAEAIAFPEKDGRSPVAVCLQIPGEQFERAKRDIPIEVYTFAVGPEKGFEAYTHGFCTVPSGDANGKLQQNGIRYSDVMVLRAGVDYQIRVVVRDNSTGELGAMTVKVTTRKDPNSFNMATPFFVPSKSEWTNVLGYNPEKPPARAGLTAQEYPITYRSKPCPVEIYPNLLDGKGRGLLVKLYNFGLEPGKKDPDVAISWEIMDSTGKHLTTPGYQLMEKSNRISETNLEYLFQIQTEKLPPGLCWLKVYAEDKISRKSATDWVPLLIK